MNRAWQAFFGRGLVATVEDFGTRGERPTHPELLDWLATEFPRQGWSLKAMHRLIVTSATYRQSSKAPPALLARDPRNELLARGPRFRVESETVRDIALAASGLLDPTIGGPSVYPPQPDGVTALAYGQVGLADQQGARPLPPGALHLHQADRPVRRLRHLRHAHLRGRLRPPRAVEHAAPGPHAAQRPGLRRGRPGARPSGRRAKARATPKGGPGSPSGSASAESHRPRRSPRSSSSATGKPTASGSGELDAVEDPRRPRPRATRSSWPPGRPSPGPC